MFWRRRLTYWEQRLQEPTTWLGAIPVVTVVLKQFFHIDLTPEQHQQITDAVITILGSAHVVSRDSNKRG